MSKTQYNAHFLKKKKKQQQQQQIHTPIPLTLTKITTTIKYTSRDV